MQEGSLVECTKQCGPMFGLTVPRGTILTVDRFEGNGGFVPVEMPMPLKTDSGIVYALAIEHFREIQPPMDINLEQLLQESLHA